jgi:hypothetical protein
MPDSILRQAISRLQKALTEGDKSGVPYGTAQVRTYDVRILFETIKKYGGRKDWTPTKENVDQLPGPVKRYIRELEGRRS